MFTYIFPLLIITLNALILKFTLDNEKENCECALKWHHKIVKYLAPTMITISVLGLLSGLFLNLDNLKNYVRVGSVFLMMFLLISILYSVALITQFIDLKINNCECSENWKRVLLLYPLVPLLFVIGNLFLFLIFSPELGKPLKLKKLKK